MDSTFLATYFFFFKECDNTIDKEIHSNPTLKCTVLLRNPDNPTAMTNYQEKIKFLVFNESMHLVTTSTGYNDLCLNGTQRKLAIVVHGWLEDCKVNWVTNLMKNLNDKRRGCVICMDYSTYSFGNYSNLAHHFNGTVEVLTHILNDLHSRNSFDPSNMYLFGFSFGAHVVLEAGRRFAKNSPVKIKQIDVCQPTGTNRQNVVGSLPLPKDAGQNVQCIHTDIRIGTFIRDCHQDWNMGDCGEAQAGEGNFFGNSSHSLFSAFYNSAFEHKFPAIRKPNKCKSNKAASGSDLNNFNMGYSDALKHEGRFSGGKEFFANTYRNYTYNEPSNQEYVNVTVKV